MIKFEHIHILKVCAKYDHIFEDMFEGWDRGEERWTTALLLERNYLRTISHLDMAFASSFTSSAIKMNDYIEYFWKETSHLF